MTLSPEREPQSRPLSPTPPHLGCAPRPRVTQGREAGSLPRGMSHHRLQLGWQGPWAGGGPPLPSLAGLLKLENHWAGTG